MHYWYAAHVSSGFYGLFVICYDHQFGLDSFATFSLDLVRIAVYLFIFPFFERVIALRILSSSQQS